MPHMQAGQDDVLPALSAPQAGEEATLTEMVCGEKETTDEGKGRWEMQDVQTFQVSPLCGAR